jgi:hypothetical protein
MQIKVLKGRSSDLLECTEPNAKPFYIAVPTGTTSHLRSAADWESYFANGVFSEGMPSSIRAAYEQPEAAPDGYRHAIDARTTPTAVRPTTRFATGHTDSPDGYAANLHDALGPNAPPPIDPLDGYENGLRQRGIVTLRAVPNPDGYGEALGRRKVS